MNANTPRTMPPDRLISHICARIHDDSGGSTLEYMLILAVVVIPMGIAVLKFAPHMVKLYGERMADYIALPFP